jgi:putative ABC transport system permease protein
MRVVRRARNLLRNLFWRRRVEQDLDEEIRAYVEMLAVEYERGGLPPVEARRRARLEAGGVEQVKEVVRDSRAGAQLDTLWRDLAYGTRMLARHPGFTLVAVLTLALGIGANTALFSVVHTLLIGPLPYRDADRLAYVHEFWPHEQPFRAAVSPDYGAWRDGSRLAAGVAAFGSSRTLNLASDEGPERLEGTAVTANFLDLIGVPPVLGRNFTEDEDRPDGPPAVVLTHGLWQRRFGSSPDVLGERVELDEIPRTVVGVLPASFLFPDNEFQPDVLLPMGLPAHPDWSSERDFRVLRVMARLKPGVQAATVAAEFLELIRPGFAQEPPQFVTMRRDMEVRVVPLRERLSGDIRGRVLILQGAAILVLLIGCLNVANLQIARSVARRKEMALRSALGAGRGRLARQLLTESLLLSGAGWVAGLAVGYWGIGLMRSYLPASLHLAEEIHLDATALSFAIAVAVITGLVTGVAPALFSSQVSLNTRNATAAPHQRLRGALVVAEVAIAVVLVTASGLLIRSFLRMATVDLGFDPHNVLTMRIALPEGRYPDPGRRVAFFDQVLERVRHLPGVDRAALSTGLPLVGARNGAGTTFDNRPEPPPGARPVIAMDMVGPSYFGAMRIALRRGRFFTEADRYGAQRVAIVNEAFGAQFYPGVEPLGRRIMPGSGDWAEIVGVVANVRQNGLQDNEAPTIYVPYHQVAAPDMVLVMRTAGPPGALASVTRKAVLELDPDQPVHDVATMEERIAKALKPQRTNMTLMGALAGLALVLAATGIFGVLAYLVSRRSQEIGIRMALGAQRNDVIGLVVRHGIMLVVFGIAIGTAGAFAATHLLTTLLYEVSPHDPWTFFAVPLVFVGVAALACYFPARWAAAVDPAVTLRHE